ncbi:RAQPRD family integrative conjugative element protein [Phocoenobacter skyensis]|uniref:integrative conjugative element protein, RAQPRD family n=1 Tax=Phocoenobacter skyensis TaxID=97481 RepID=UPI002766DE5A|nr:RAQPRD family integrative conjugative element protein [Pasteurella skyensis]MDP8185315.1 RAQPRD family integrative conjugative element protein [Pasteurella skyensis]
MLKSFKYLTVFVLFSCCSITQAQATEQERLEEAIKLLDAAQLSLKRAYKESVTSPKSREYFDYSAIYKDIDAIKRGIKQYINPSRAIPRDPKSLRTLKEDYTKLRGQ